MTAATEDSSTDSATACECGMMPINLDVYLLMLS